MGQRDAQQLRVSPVLPGDPSLVPSTHTGGSQLPVSLAIEDLVSSCKPTDTCANQARRYTFTHKN